MPAINSLNPSLTDGQAGFDGKARRSGARDLDQFTHLSVGAPVRVASRVQALAGHVTVGSEASLAVRAHQIAQN